MGEVKGECFTSVSGRQRDTFDGHVFEGHMHVAVFYTGPTALLLCTLNTTTTIKPCPQVTEDDVRAAYRLWFDALSGSAADEEGRLDMNLLTGVCGWVGVCGWGWGAREAGAAQGCLDWLPPHDAAVCEVVCQQAVPSLKLGSRCRIISYGCG